MYSPKIRDDQVASLYRLKEEIGVPMPRLLQEAADQFLEWSHYLGPQMLTGYFDSIASGDRQLAYELASELAGHVRNSTTEHPGQARLLLKYQKTIERLEEENHQLKASQHELMESSEDWLNFEAASDDIKWYAVKVLKTLRK